MGKHFSKCEKEARACNIAIYYCSQQPSNLLHVRTTRKLAQLHSLVCKSTIPLCTTPKGEFQQQQKKTYLIEILKVYLSNVFFLGNIQKPAWCLKIPMDTESQFPPTENWDVEIEEGGRK
jgi:hypothetical protein